MPLEGKVLADRTEAGEQCLGAIGIAKSAHAPLAFSGRLMAVLSAVVDACSRLDEDTSDDAGGRQPTQECEGHTVVMKSKVDNAGQRCR